MVIALHTAQPRMRRLHIDQAQATTPMKHHAPLAPVLDLDALDDSDSPEQSPAEALTPIPVERGPRPTDALLDAIYQSALNPDQFAHLHNQLLTHLREDRSRDDTPLTRVMLSHIKRALRLGRAHSAMQRERQQVLDTLDAVAPPIVVVDDRMRIVGSNHAADSLLANHPVLSIEDGCLHCQQQDFLPELIAQADQHECTSARCEAPGTTTSPDDLLLYAYKNLAREPSSGQALYSLLIIERRRSIQHSIAYLANRTSLTSREVEIVDLSFQGLSLEAICEHTQVTLFTLRQHIKNIYAKTGAHNQNALFALVLRNVVLEQAGRSPNAKLLPHLTGLAQSRLLRLDDGRQLSYAEYGAPDGMPVLYFHAINGSRLELLMHAERLHTHGIRLIAMDRPGYGHSSFIERDDYRDYTEDVRALLDALQLDSVHALAASAGCAHAITAAHALGGRIRAVHCTAVIPPIDFILASSSRSMLNGLMNRFFRVVPSLLRPGLELALYGQTVESMLALLTKMRHNPSFPLASEDVDFIHQPEHRPYVGAYMMESLRQGPRGWAMEGALLNRAWSIDLREIKQTIHLWHGTCDGLIPNDMVAAFGAALPHAECHVVEGGTHLLVLRNIAEIARAIRYEQ